MEIKTRGLADKYSCRVPIPIPIRKHTTISERTMKRLTKLLSSCLLGVGIVSAALATETNAPIKVGSILSVTGAAAYLGTPELKTLQMYVEELNKSGGVLGRQLQLVHYDDGSDASKANAFAKRLIEDDKVDFIVGRSEEHTSELQSR